MPQEAAGQILYVCATSYDVLRNALSKQLRILTHTPLRYKKIGAISLQCKLFDFNDYTAVSVYVNADT